MDKVGARVYGSEVLPGVMGWERSRGGTYQSGGPSGVPTVTGNFLDMDGTYPIRDGEACSGRGRGGD